MSKPHWNTFKGQDDAAYEALIDLRYRVLRKPWNQPLTSAVDSSDAEAIHTVAFINNTLVACGRLHACDTLTGQLRYMAVCPKFQNTGLGAGLIKHLEIAAQDLNLKYIQLNAREAAVVFYERHGYLNQGYCFTLWDSIRHYKMTKTLNPK